MRLTLALLGIGSVLVLSAFGAFTVAYLVACLTMVALVVGP